MIKKFRNKYFPLTKNEERALISKYEKKRDNRVKKQILSYLNEDHGIIIAKNGKTKQIIEEIVARVNSGHLRTFRDIESYLTGISKHRKEHVVSALTVLVKSDILDYNCRLTIEYSRKNGEECKRKIVNCFANKLLENGIDAKSKDVEKVFFSA